MADLTPLNYKPEEAEDMGQGFDLIQPGTYPVIIVDSDIRDTKAGTGKYLDLEYQIIEGPDIGKKINDRLNIRNPSEVAQKIALSNLKHICDAIGFAGSLSDSNQLHGKPFSVTVGVEEFKSENTGKMRKSNTISRRMAKQSLSIDAPVAAVPPAEQTEKSAPRAGTW